MKVAVYWGYLIVLWLFHVVCILCYGCFNWFCNVWVCVCVYLYLLCFILFVLCFCIVSFMYIICFACASVKPTATEWSNNNNNNNKVRPFSLVTYIPAALPHFHTLLRGCLNSRYVSFCFIVCNVFKPLTFQGPNLTLPFLGMSEKNFRNKNDCFFMSLWHAEVNFTFFYTVP